MFRDGFVLQQPVRKRQMWIEGQLLEAKWNYDEVDQPGAEDILDYLNRIHTIKSHRNRRVPVWTGAGDEDDATTRDEDGDTTGDEDDETSD